MNKRPALVALLLLTSGLMPGPALAEDLTFRLTNGSSSRLVGFYASPVEVENWEENMVEVPLEPGESADAHIADGRSVCRYDLRIEFPDADPFIEEDVDLCSLGTYTVTDEN